jgi:hypothetical protein
VPLSPLTGAHRKSPGPNPGLRGNRPRQGPESTHNVAEGEHPSAGHLTGGPDTTSVYAARADGAARQVSLQQFELRTMIPGSINRWPCGTVLNEELLQQIGVDISNLFS